MIYKRVLWVSLEGPSIVEIETDFLRDRAETELLTRSATRGMEGVTSLRFNGLSSFDRLKDDGSIVGVHQMSVLMDIEATSEEHAEAIMKSFYDVAVGKRYYNKYTIAEVFTIERGVAVG